MNPNDKNKVIGPRKPNEVSKKPTGVELANGSRKPKESKWAVDTQRKA